MFNNEIIDLNYIIPAFGSKLKVNTITLFHSRCRIIKHSQRSHDFINAYNILDAYHYYMRIFKYNMKLSSYLNFNIFNGKYKYYY